MFQCLFFCDLVIILIVTYSVIADSMSFTTFQERMIGFTMKLKEFLLVGHILLSGICIKHIVTSKISP